MEKRIQAVIGAWVLCFMLPIHNQPLVHFYTEWLCAALFLILVLQVIVWGKKKNLSNDIRIPMSVGIPIGLGLALVCQKLLGIGNQDWAQFMGLVYACAGIGVMLSVAHLRRFMPIQKIVENVAIAIIAVGVISVLITWIQWGQWEEHFFPWVSPVSADRLPRRMYANLNQANHLCTLLGLGLVACAYFWFAYDGIKVRVLMTLISFMLITGLMLTISRMAWLYIGLTICAVQIYIVLSKKFTWYKWILIFWGVSGGGLLAALVLSGLIGSWQLGQSAVDVSSFQKILSGHIFDSRKPLWIHAWGLFMANPYFGIGFGDYAWGIFSQNTLSDIKVEFSNNAHNLFLDLLAKVGLIGAALVLIPLLCYCTRVVKSMTGGKLLPKNGQIDLIEDVSVQILVLMWILILFIHSLLEFPLHYLYFWLPLCFFVGLLEPRYKSIDLSGFKLYFLAKISVVSVIILAVFILSTTWLDYRKVEVLYRENKIRQAEDVQTKIWFSNYARFAYLDTEDDGVLTTKEELKLRLQVFEKSIKFIPHPMHVRRTALIQARLGDESAAFSLLNHLLKYEGGNDGKIMLAMCDRLIKENKPEYFCQYMMEWANTGVVPKPILNK
ncbi:MAG: O-antigen ligase C-terminal domain-containing protein [Burkholderiales bacterium]|nr:O-antigen ligase C-terminal domain-containing protein [Burkholderiales bacterium]